MAISPTNHGFMCEWRPRVSPHSPWKCPPNGTRKPTLPWHCRRAVSPYTTCLSVGSYPFSFAEETVKPSLFRNGSARLSFIVIVFEPQSTFFVPRFTTTKTTLRDHTRICAVLLSLLGTVNLFFEAPSWVSTSFDPTLGFPGEGPDTLIPPQWRCKSLFFPAPVPQLPGDDWMQWARATMVGTIPIHCSAPILGSSSDDHVHLCLLALAECGN
jgi:hypothetical protein